MSQSPVRTTAAEKAAGKQVLDAVRQAGPVREFGSYEFTAKPFAATAQTYKLHVGPVVSGPTGTVLSFRVTSPQPVKGTSEDNPVLDHMPENYPVLIGDGKRYGVNTAKSLEPRGYLCAVASSGGQVGHGDADVYQMFASYPPLPDSLTHVEVTSDSATGSVKVPVTRSPAGGAPPIAAEGPAAPLLAAMEVTSSRLSQRIGGARGGPVVLGLHGVRRIEGATLVYYSLTVSEDTVIESMFGEALFNSYTERVGVIPAFRRGPVTGLLVDAVRRRLYLPLTDQTKTCVACSGSVLTLAPDADLLTRPGQSRIGWFATPELPPEVTVVDVLVGNRMFHDIAVADGELTPLYPMPWPLLGDPEGYPDEGPVLGESWPRWNPKVLEHIDASVPSVVPFFVTVGAVDNSERDRSDAKSRNVELDASVLFGKDSDVVRPAGKALVVKVGRELAARKVAGTVKVTGYTDDLGSEAHGLDLSRRRAAAVARILTPLLPAGTKVVTEGKGEADPVASNDTEAGRKLNRRVTITVKK